MDAYDELMAALGYYFGDGEMLASEESIRRLLARSMTQYKPLRRLLMNIVSE